MPTRHGRNHRRVAEYSDVGPATPHRSIGDRQRRTREDFNATHSDREKPDKWAGFEREPMIGLWCLNLP
jgi:hypothetical protein